MVADLIRNKPVSDAQAILKFTVRKASEPILKVLESAIANAKNNFKKDSANLYIAKIMIDGGPILKRTLPRSRGRADMIQKRSSHVTIVLRDKTEPVSSEATEKEEKPAATDKKEKSTKK